MIITKKEINSLKQAKYNPRKDLKSGDAEFEKLKKSIEKYGYVEPIILNKRTGVVVGGHQRLKVLQELGYTEIDCVEVDLNEKDEKALNIALNKIHGEWNEELLKNLLKELDQSGYDITLTGFDAKETNDLFGSGSIENAQEDDFDTDKALEEIIEPITKCGDVWLLGKHKLLCGDSTNKDSVKNFIGAEKIDLVVTDPPYNVDYGGHERTQRKLGKNSTRKEANILNDDMEEEDFYNFLYMFYSNAYEVLKGGGAIYVFHSTKESVNFITAMKNAKFKVAQTLVWVKNHFALGLQDYQWQHEALLYGWKEKKGCGHYFINDRSNSTLFEGYQKEVSKYTKEEFRAFFDQVLSHFQSDVIRYDKPNKSPEHPTMKPIVLCAKLIYNSSRENEIVYDPFGGSGSTLIACEQLNRKCRMVELEPKYCDVIVQRFKENFPEEKILHIKEES